MGQNKYDYDAPYHIEREVRAILGLLSDPQQSYASPKEYVYTCVSKLAVIEPDQFKRLSKEAKHWYDYNADAILGSKEMMYFNGRKIGVNITWDQWDVQVVYDEDAPTDERLEASVEMTNPHIDDSKDRLAPVSSRRNKKKRKGREIGPKRVNEEFPAVYYLYYLFLRYGFTVNDQLILKKMREAGYRAGLSTVRAHKYNFRRMIQVLDEYGFLNEEKHLPEWMGL